MAILDSILNVVALLLWLSWRALRFDPLTRTSVASLAGTLKRAEPRTVKSWQLLAGLAGLVLGRALLYSQIGPAADWTPRLDLGVVVLAFRCDKVGATLLYSVVGFLRLLAIFYFWVVVLVVINGKAPEPNAVDRILRLHLGRLSRWPWPVQLLFPGFLTAAAWMALYPLMVRAGFLTRVGSFPHLAEQGFVVGAALILTLKYLLPSLLLLYLVTSYVFLGSNSVWDFVNATAPRLLAPLRGIPLRLGKVDFAPVVGAAIVLLLLEALPAVLLGKYPGLRGAIWPQ